MTADREPGDEPGGRRGVDERRRRVLGALTTVVVGGIAGCLGDDNREVHAVFRSWEDEGNDPGRRASIVAHEGEVLRIAIDDRRDVPVETIIGIYEPGDEFIETRSLTPTPPRSPDPPVTFYHVRADGRHEFAVRPQTGDVDPTRVWVRITPHDSAPDRQDDAVD